MTTKSIKISEQTYTRLHAIQRPRETISEVVDRLLATAEIFTRALPLINNEAAWIKATLAEKEVK